MKLHQLPNGDWIDLTTVQAIRAFPREKSFVGNDFFPHRVSVVMSDGSVHSCQFESWEDAENFRDELAGEVNDASL